MGEWNGEERRTADSGNFHQQLGELRVRMAHIEEAVKNFSAMKDDLHSIKELLQQARGGIAVLRTVFMWVAPIGAFITWMATHVDWTAK